MRAFDTVIVGAGQAGLPAARALAARGRHVALVERAHPGGSCVNFGCTPSKALIASARVAHQARTATAWGIRVSGCAVDFAAVMDRVRGVIAEAVSSLERDLAGTNDPTLVRGHARLDGRTADGLIRVAVRTGNDAEELLARTVVLDTGTRSAIPELPGLGPGCRAPHLITAENWVHLDALPERLVILGGSYLGLEFGQAFARLGARVTILQGGDRLAPREDADVSDAIRDILRAEGIALRLGIEAERVEWPGDGVRVHLAGGEVVAGTHLLVATGRRPNTDELGLDALGIGAEDGGLLAVDDRLRTGAEGVWAAGDITPGPQFTHLAYADHVVVVEAIAGADAAGDQVSAAHRVVPYAMFVDPPLGRVGLTEEQARAAGHRVRVGRKDMATSGKAKELGETAGFIKVLADADTGRVLGAACLCHAGAEVVQIVTALMTANVSAAAALDAIAIHPTIGEALKNAIRDACGD